MTAFPRVPNDWEARDLEKFLKGFRFLGVRPCRAKCLHGFLPIMLFAPD
jgi:hypothetical protein